MWECRTDAAVIDNSRSDVFDWIERKAAELEPERLAWVANAPEPIRHLASRFHGPLWQFLLAHFGSPEADLLPARLQGGFPVVGELDSFPHEAGTKSPKPATLSVVHLDELKGAYNDHVLSQVRPSDPDGVTMDETMDDVEFGAMIPPVPLEKKHVDMYHLSRCFVVQQWSVAKQQMKNRVVHHLTESGLNAATVPVSTSTTQSLDWQVWLLCVLLFFGHQPGQWKRDVKKAFRCLPNMPEHFRYAGVVFQEGLQLYFSLHLASSFGGIAAVQNWHRVGAALSFLLLRALRVPVGRFVDDFFGASRSDLKWSGGRCLDRLAALLGLIVEPAKSEDDKLRMKLLGGKVSVCMERRAVNTEIDEEKAAQWSQEFAEHISSEVMDAGRAAKGAGRMAFAVTVTHDKVGRPFIKPLYRQQFDPLPGGAVSVWLKQALIFWIAYMCLRPSRWTSHTQLERPHSYAWTDACGETAMIAAVVIIHGQMYYSFCNANESFLQQLLPRGDKQIGVLEMTAVFLLLEVFGNELSGHLLSLWVDNQGCLYSLIKASSKAPECNKMAAHFWLYISRREINARLFYVESKANIADGPTRDDLDLLRFFQAVPVEARLPEWIFDLWSLELVDFAMMLKEV